MWNEIFNATDISLNDNKETCEKSNCLINII